MTAHAGRAAPVPAAAGARRTPGSRRSAAAEHLGRRAVLGDVAGVVVVDLVVVPRHDEREAGVRPLQVAVGLVERVAQPELVERDGLVGVLRGQLDAADAAGRRVDAVLVRVVAEEDDEVEVLLRHVGVGVVEALLPLLARGVGEGHPVEAPVGCGRGARPGGRRGPVAGGEPVPVLAAGLEAAHVDVHRVRQISRRDRAPRRTTRRMRSSRATSHPTSTLPTPPSPPSAVSGSGARRVQSTTPSGSGSPDATPSVNGFVRSRGGPGARGPAPSRRRTRRGPPTPSPRRERAAA